MCLSKSTVGQPFDRRLGVPFSNLSNATNRAAANRPDCVRPDPAEGRAAPRGSVEVPPVVDVAERLAVSSERFVQRLRCLVVLARREQELA